MILNLKRCMSLLLVLMLLIGIVPTAFAAEVTPDSTVPEETTSHTEEATTATGDEIDPTEPTEPTDPPEASADPTILSEGTAVDAPAMMSAADDYGVMTIASTQSGIMLFDFTDNGDYTTRLNSQIAVEYRPNGTDSPKTAYHKNMGWHFARYNNVPYADDPLYCIEPYRGFAASTSGNSVDRGVTLDGSGSTSGTNVWYALPADRREAIGLILLYSNEMWDHSISVTTTKKDSNPNVPLRIATQFLIFEIVCGLRDPETFVLNDTNECGTSGDIYYNAGVDSVPYFAPNYNQLVSYVQAALEIPSFTSRSSSSAPTITLTGEETVVTDTNGVLSNFSFTDGNGASFYKNGNSLYITQTGTVSESTVFRATRSIPSAANSTYNIWYMSGSTYQTTISLYNPSTGTLNAYFRLKAPATADLAIKKTTEDGKNLSGWQFGIYSDSSCTSLISGPHTTDSGGNISVTGLSAGTVYVKELGHTNSAINALYSCSSTNPQRVTLTGGSTATVTFNNDLVHSYGRIIKQTNTGKDLGGRKFNLYTDEALTQLVDGSPFTTPDTGILDIELLPGDYWCQEVDESEQYPFWVFDNSVQKVTVKAGETATVTFTNTHYGRGRIIKVMPDGGSVAGWVFDVYRVSDNAHIGTYTSGEDGTILTDYVLPGEYRIEEQIPDDRCCSGYSRGFIWALCNSTFGDTKK